MARSPKIRGWWTWIFPGCRTARADRIRGQRHALPASRQHRRSHSRQRQRSGRIRGFRVGESSVQPVGIAHGGEAGHVCVPPRFPAMSEWRIRWSAAHARERRPGGPEFHREECAKHRAQPGQCEVAAASEALPRHLPLRTGCRSNRVGHRLRRGRRPSTAARRHLRSGPDCSAADPEHTGSRRW